LPFTAIPFLICVPVPESHVVELVHANVDDAVEYETIGELLTVSPAMTHRCLERTIDKMGLRRGVSEAGVTCCTQTTPLSSLVSNTLPFGVEMASKNMPSPYVHAVANPVVAPLPQTPPGFGMALKGPLAPPTDTICD
jgi:hypothetical protein